ncbi:MAG: hypothetical protein K0U40_05095 [Betaproteobacteria bacterium]|nr:hypothetical protein [Betaproteobacteria bacterium]
MASYKLDTAFTNEQLAVLNTTGTNVVVAKPTAGSGPNVAWQVFHPMQDNTLSWEELYGIYASTSEVTNGAILTQLSSTGLPALENKLYTIEPSGAVSGPASGGTPASLAMLNNYSYKTYLTVGLYQDATVNGTKIIGNALSAAPVLLKSTATMTPFTIIYIWLASQVISNTVVTTVTSPMTKLVFGGGVDNISVAYDSESGTFIPTTGNPQLKKETVQYFLPSL